MKNFKSNLFVVLLVIFIFVCGFMIGKIDFRTDVNDEDLEDGNVVTNEKDTSNLVSSKEFMALFVGKYNYEKIYDEMTNCKDYANLEVNSDGTYLYKHGSTCGGGWTLRGNYAISEDKIYLFNDDCKIVVVNNECVEPNCSSLEELNYTLLDDKVRIFNGTIELEKE